MRFMMLMIPKGYEHAAPGTMPDAKAVEAMMKYNESLQQAGVLITFDDLHPPSMGARVTFSGGKARVIDGPAIEAEEVLGGYWMIEVRQVQVFADFPADVQAAASGFPEMQAQSGRRAGM